MTRLPIWLKLAFTAFMAVLVPYYWACYGPTNFLYFCDVALFFTLAAVWTEWPLLASMPLVGIFLPQLLWNADFFGGLFGHPLIGLTSYMFDPGKPLFTRGLSFFHCWLPFLLLGMVWRLGYDRRAFAAWTILAWVLMWICFLFMPAPPPPPESPNLPTNINYVYGLSDRQPQTWMHPWAYFFVLQLAMPAVIFWPTHWMLARWFPAAPRIATSQAPSAPPPPGSSPG